MTEMRLKPIARGLLTYVPAINDLLSVLRPRLHLCGHHHRFVEATREGVRSVCIDRINRSYLLIDATTLTYRKIDQ